MQSNLSRRDFLNLLTGLAASSAVSGCTALDQLVMGATGDQSQTVVILGGGLAGLAAAYTLRKSGVRFLLLEGSSRLGGRAWTLQHLTASGQFGEAGAEWFSSRDRLILDWAKELKLEVQESLGQRDQVAIGEGLFAWSSLERDKSLGRLFRSRLPADDLNLAEWGRRQSTDSWWADLLESWSQFHFGAGSEQIDARYWLARSADFASLREVLGQTRFQFRAGTSSFVQALTDRVVGVIPGERIRLRHQLVQVEKYSQGYEMIFETPEGRRRVRATKVICALPWAVLPAVQGLEELTKSFDSRHLGLSYQEKAVVVLDAKRMPPLERSAQRFWTRQPVWDSTQRPLQQMTVSERVISLLNGPIDAEAAKARLSKLALLAPEVLNVKNAQLEVSQRLWSSSMWSKARGVYLSPQTKRIDFSSGLDDGWQWAGEHTAGFASGSMLGALESGRRAALGFIGAGRAGA